jgi:hypothetical protein
MSYSEIYKKRNQEYFKSKKDFKEQEQKDEQFLSEFIEKPLTEPLKEKRESSEQKIIQVRENLGFYDKLLEYFRGPLYMKILKIIGILLLLALIVFTISQL